MRLNTVHLASDQVVATLGAEFEERANADGIEACVERLENDWPVNARRG